MELHDVHRAGELHHLQPGGLDGQHLGIGFFPEAEYEEQTLQLEPGDRLYLYSDGVTEAMDKDLQQFGDDALVEVVTLNRSRPL